MESTKIESLPPPPGIISSIKAGFDAIASHIPAILLPLLLNLFLWLGPRLRMDALFSNVEGSMASYWKTAQVPAEEIQTTMTMYHELMRSLNLFGLMRTLPIGVSNLFSMNQDGVATPLGVPGVLQVNFLTLPLWVMTLVAIGWTVGALYFRVVAWAALAEKVSAWRGWMTLLQTVLISIFCNFILAALGFPAMLILFVAMQFSAALANMIVLLIALASVWAVVPIFFWAHGVFLNRQNVFAAMLSSLRLTRFTLPTSSLFVMVVFLISYGLGYLWRIPKSDSWLTLAGIFGHSFVTTALLAGSFIYYYEMNVWVQAALEKLRPNHIVKQA